MPQFHPTSFITSETEYQTFDIWLLFSSFSLQLIGSKKCPWLNSNCGSLALPTMPQPLPTGSLNLSHQKTEVSWKIFLFLANFAAVKSSKTYLCYLPTLVFLLYINAPKTRFWNFWKTFKYEKTQGCALSVHHFHENPNLFKLTKCFFKSKSTNPRHNAFNVNK